MNSPIRKKQGAFGPGSGVVLVVLATLLVMFLPSMPAPTATMDYLAPGNSLSDRISQIFPRNSNFAMREDFKMDLRNWQGLDRGTTTDWHKLASSVRLGDLRLWKPTLSLADYNMQFAGQIENKAMGWAFRAADVNNYYAAKINVSKGFTDNPPRAEIVRYAVVGGRQLNKTQLPIPLSIAVDTLYEVKVRVKGDRFTTVVNGQLVDSWTDRRLARGGVGFFNDPGEKANLHWVAVSESEGFLKRFLSFSLLVHPAALE